ncbi:hypothetical protein MPTK1_2g25180 [Marchantia polymorpha subsp. ruderalis]|uniref:Uncharacterized protein n=1 Tax=Marchantia polymorpha TaxID=3197 RepID=A0A2R6W347_MARPO|nr:hypothetical protein MARPO_0168s0015 [Marchantia polymorpha]BBN03651.1 hypothetical protein Mp_2g25180 [Marchantia polymorpha subsp. ruderalis]|eukprot:PTQ28291.1 hypothetical protein MARPO_0168s0015 [Marchantia polymorpha]
MKDSCWIEGGLRVEIGTTLGARRSPIVAQVSGSDCYVIQAELKPTLGDDFEWQIFSMQLTSWVPLNVLHAFGPVDRRSVTGREALRDEESASAFQDVREEKTTRPWIRSTGTSSISKFLPHSLLVNVLTYL